MEYVICNLCGEDNTKLLFEKEGKLLHEKFKFVKCRNCGMVYVNPRLSDKEISKLYEEDYFKGEGFGPDDYISEFDTAKKTEEVERIMDHIEVITGIGKDARILDVGFGMGDFMRAAAKRGYDVHGTDISDYACKSAREKGFNVRKGRLLDTGFDADYFDVIVAIELLEHDHDPSELMKEIYRILKPGGLFFHRTANITMYRLDGKDCHYYMPEGHIYYFTFPTMKRYLIKTGFEPVDFYKYYPKYRKPVKLLMKYGFLDPQNDYPKTLKEKIFYQVFVLFDLIKGKEHLLGQKKADSTDK